MDVVATTLRARMTSRGRTSNGRLRSEHPRLQLAATASVDKAGQRRFLVAGDCTLVYVHVMTGGVPSLFAAATVSTFFACLLSDTFLTHCWLALYLHFYCNRNFSFFLCFISYTAFRPGTTRKTAL